MIWGYTGGFLACCLVKRPRIVSQRKKVMHECGTVPLWSFMDIAALQDPLGVLIQYYHQ